MTSDDRRRTGSTEMQDLPLGIVTSQVVNWSLGPRMTAGTAIPSLGRFRSGLATTTSRSRRKIRPTRLSSGSGLTRMTRSYPSSTMSTERSSVVTSRRPSGYLSANPAAGFPIAVRVNSIGALIRKGPRATLEQAEVKRGFQLGDPPGQGGFRASGGPRGPSEPAVPGDEIEIG